MPHQVSGERHYAAKLTVAKVSKLKIMQRHGELSNIEMINIYSKAYCVSPLAIRNVLEGVTWKHVK